MFINHQVPFVFISATKSGSSSVNALLQEAFGGENLRNTTWKVPDNCKDYYSFIVVRNPYARMISWWWSICKADGGDRYGHKRELRQHKLTESLADFITLWNIKGDYSQALYYNLNVPVDSIVHLENIEQEINALPFIKTSIKIPRRNVKDHPSWMELLDDESRELINTNYAEDFELFGYEKL